MGKRERARARKLKKRAKDKGGKSGRGGRKKGFVAIAKRNVANSALAAASSPSNSEKKSRKKRGGALPCADAVPFGVSRGKESCLVVGDGDFSFSWSFARMYFKANLSVKQLVCTSYDSNSDVLRKYGSVAEDCVKRLTDRNVRVAHDIDGTNLEGSGVSSMRFDHIIFNFPHSGAQRVHENRVLLRDFFASASRALKPAGKIHVTIKICPPYNGWNIEENAKRSGLLLTDVVPFDAAMWYRLGYRHRTTKADAVELQNVRDSKTFVFMPVQAQRYVKNI